MPAPAPACAPESRAHVAAWAVGLALVVGLVLSPVLGARAIGLDDPTLIVANPLVTHPSLAGVGRVFREVLHPTVMNAYYMPLSMASLALDAALGGSATDLVPFHLTNLVLHLVAIVLLFLVLRRLTGSTPAAACAALMVGVHPVMVEAIASAGERKTVLATALACGALLTSLREGRRTRFATWLLYVLALLAKPSVLTLPLVFVMVERLVQRRTSRAALVAWWPFAVTAGVGAFVASRSVAATWEFGTPPPFDAGLVALKAVWSLGFYARTLVWPVNLSTVYAPPAPFAMSNPTVLLGVGLALALGLSAWALRRRAPALGGGLLVAVTLLTPTFGILRFSPVICYDRYLHLPMVGVAMALAFGLAAGWRMPAPRRTIVAALLLVVVVGEVVATRQAFEPWRDTLALWRRAVAVAPQVAPSHNGLGATLDERGDAAGAIAAFEQAIAVDPGYGDGHYNLARARRRAGQPERALPAIERAAVLSPGSGSVELEWGLCLSLLGRSREAVPHLQRALALRVDERVAALPLGLAMYASGDLAEGVRWLRRAVAANDDPVARLYLAQALDQDPASAREVAALLADALRLAPGRVPVLNEVAWWHATAPEGRDRDTTLALTLSARALELSARPDAGVLDTRAAALAAAGRFDEAVAIAQRAQDAAAGDTALVRDLVQRLAGYRAHRSYRRPAAQR